MTNRAEQIAIISFTKNGKLLEEQILNLPNLNITAYNKEINPNAKIWVQDNFNNYSAFIFIGAAGIALRYVAPVIISKDVDPAIIVIDELAINVIPILSGHLGGANELAEILATQLGANLVLTAATDINNKFACDVWTKNNNCKIIEINKIKKISSAVLNNEEVGISSIFPLPANIPEELTNTQAGEIGIYLDLEGKNQPFKETLNVVPQIISLGLGCRRDTDSEAFETFILKTLEEQQISIKAVADMASIDLKKDEKCILDFSKKYNIPFKAYTKDELLAVEGEFTGSEFVRKITGVESVCERSAKKISGNLPFLPKTAENGMTIAISKKDWRCRF